MKSVRRRLLLGTAAATIAIFVTAAISLYLLARHFLISEFDSALRARIQSIASMTEFDLSEMRLDADDALQIPEYRGGDNPEYFEVTSEDGKHVVRSATLADRRIDLPRPTGPGRFTAFVQLPDGRRGRAMIIRAKTQPDENVPGAEGPGISIMVAKATGPLDRMLGQLKLLLVVVCGVATLVLLAISAWVIRRGLHPLDRLARRIGGIGADHLGERLDIEDVPDELQPVVSRLNDLLERLQAAFEREKCFTADAAHELRTPLAGIATALEVCAREKRDLPQYERVVHNCLTVTRQMQGVIDNLLLLARADAGQVRVNRSAVDVTELLRESWSRFDTVAQQRCLDVRLDLDQHLLLDTDREKLGIILNNLLENAVQYADERGKVCVAATNSQDTVKVSVSNTGSRVRPEDSARVFDRFWRGDSARASGGRNCGLGLAVCRKLATALHADISVDCEPSGLFTVRLVLRNVPSLH